MVYEFDVVKKGCAKTKFKLIHYAQNVLPTMLFYFDLITTVFGYKGITFRNTETGNYFF